MVNVNVNVSNLQTTNRNDYKVLLAPGALNNMSWYLHGASLAVADDGRPSQDVDCLRGRKCLVWLVLGEVLQTALVRLLVFILSEQKRKRQNLFNLTSPLTCM